MAIPKVLIASIFLSLSNPNQSKTADSPKMDCGGACAARCILSKRPNLCKRACGACCARCNCVPPGTYGNYEACPCYAEMTTRDNKPKCP
ncbi:hypothetical protein Pfo_002859 [Paulownia fortunei]|nr:hypothetical protein Pfo_002859 [Paulownia fortunei]